MSHQKKLAYSYIKRFIFSCSSWIFFLTLILLILSQWTVSLYGLNPNEPLQSFLSFSPQNPWRDWGLSILSYPLIHISLEHWFVNVFFWLVLSFKINSFLRTHTILKQILILMVYGLVALIIALTYLLPVAPIALPHDRILGLSAIIFFQVGFLLISTNQFSVWIFLLALCLSYLFFGPSSNLTFWGHTAGLILGVFLGALVRFSYRKKIKN
ncbi:MAG: rhomboid family intramembrane serine protease [Oligoflexia bacterium]|nr:rhomboid family intramembrane serine protease [Oligoflexia bacterium]